MGPTQGITTPAASPLISHDAHCVCRCGVTGDIASGGDSDHTSGPHRQEHILTIYCFSMIIRHMYGYSFMKCIAAGFVNITLFCYMSVLTVDSMLQLLVIFVCVEFEG